MSRLSSALDLLALLVILAFGYAGFVAAAVCERALEVGP